MERTLDCHYICEKSITSKFFSVFLHSIGSEGSSWKTLSITNSRWIQNVPRPQLQVCKEKYMLRFYWFGNFSTFKCIIEHTHPTTKKSISYIGINVFLHSLTKREFLKYYSEMHTWRHKITTPVLNLFPLPHLLFYLNQLKLFLCFML